MSDTTTLIRLFSWLSPALPIGGFAYSQGLETAIAGNSVAAVGDVRSWIEGVLHAGSARTDACFLAIAAQAVSNGDKETFGRANDLALALQSSAERDKETREQAVSFLSAARRWPVQKPPWLEAAFEGAMALPIAFGAMAAINGIDRQAAVTGFVNAFVSQQISVAVRLVPLGQSEGLTLLAALEPAVLGVADSALSARVEDISGLGYGADIASMRHEDITVRIFRS